MDLPLGVKLLSKDEIYTLCTPTLCIRRRAEIVEILFSTKRILQTSYESHDSIIEREILLIKSDSIPVSIISTIVP